MERWRSQAVLGALSMHTSRVRIPYAPPFSGPKCCRVACLLCTQEDRVEFPADPPVLGAWPNGKALGSQPGNRGFESRCSCHLTHECGGSGIRPRLRAVVMRVRIPPLVPSRRPATHQRDSGIHLGVGQRLATCLGSRPTQVRILSPRPRGCRPAAGSGAAIARTRVRFPSASPIQAPPKLMGTSNRPLTGGQRVRGSLEAPIIAGPVVALGLITRRWKQGSTPSPATNLAGFRSRHPAPGIKPHRSPSTLSGIAATLRKWCFCPFDSDLGYQSHGPSGSLQCGALGGS